MGYSTFHSELSHYGVNERVTGATELPCINELSVSSPRDLPTLWITLQCAREHIHVKNNRNMMTSETLFTSILSKFGVV